MNKLKMSLALIALIIPLLLCAKKRVSIRPRACFSPSYNKVKSQTKHVWLLTLL